MSYFDDYVADGLCCEACGGFIDGQEPGFVRYCAGCQPAAQQPAKLPGKNSQRPWGKKARRRSRKGGAS